MMYMHYCKRCHRVQMLNGHKQFCPCCQSMITELKLSYLDYVSMDKLSRESFQNRCADEEQLKKLGTTYRMYKYSKWYKELQRQLVPTMIRSCTPVERTQMGNTVSMV